MIYISVVIPVYKCASCIPELYQKLVVVLSKITANFEIIMVEDCGGDGSWESIVTLSKQDSRVKGLQFSRNFGQHYGITAGLDYSKGEWVVVMDCDLQDQPEEILRLYQKAQEGYDVVLARRKERQDPTIKKFFSWLYYKVFSYLTEIQYDGQIANFCIISRNVVTNFCAMREQLRFFGGLINWMGFSTAYIDVQHGERLVGKSSYTFTKLRRLAANTIVAYSDKPLRISVKIGFSISFFAFCFGLYILLQAFLYKLPVAGWSSLIVSIYFIGGIIIAILGVIGIYLGKAFDETKKRPLYIISKSTF